MNKATLLKHLHDELAQLKLESGADLFGLSVSTAGSYMLTGKATINGRLVCAVGHGMTPRTALLDFRADLDVQYARRLAKTPATDAECDEARRISNEVMEEVQP